MDHVHTLLMLIVPCSVLCGHVPAPENLTIDSQHFVHLLRWQPGPGSPAGLHYKVIVRSYSKGWRTVDGCDAVLSPLFCNLTDVFSKLDETYYVNVTAILGNEMSTSRLHPPFKPESDTVLELPSLQVSPCNDSILCVYLQSPSERLHTVYNKLQYILNFTNEKGDHFLESRKGLSTVDIKVVPGLKYCVSVNITGQRFTPEPAVCALNPAAANDTDAVISVVLCLLGLMFGLGVVQLLLKTSVHFQALKASHPFVLRSFNPPYEVQLFSLPTAESLNCIYLELNTSGDVHVSEDVDPEEDAGYERRNGCEETSEEDTQNPARETYDRVPVRTRHDNNFRFAPDMTTTSQNTSPILTTNLHTLTPIKDLRKGDSTSLMLKRKKEPEQEEKEDDHQEDSDDVNFFSLTLGGRNPEQQREEEESTENDGEKMSTEIPVLLTVDIQPVYSEQTNKLISYSEEEDTDEEEAFAGYMTRS